MRLGSGLGLRLGFRVRVRVRVGGTVEGGYCPGDIVQEGYCPGGYCPGGYCPGDIVLEPQETVNCYLSCDISKAWGNHGSGKFSVRSKLPFLMTVI